MIYDYSQLIKQMFFLLSQKNLISDQFLNNINLKLLFLDLLKHANQSLINSYIHDIHLKFILKSGLIISHKLPNTCCLMSFIGKRE